MCTALGVLPRRGEEPAAGGSEPANAPVLGTGIAEGSTRSPDYFDYQRVMTFIKIISMYEEIIGSNPCFLDFYNAYEE